MLGNNVNMNWACFLIHNFMYFYLWDYIKNGKEKFELGRGYVTSKTIKIITLAVFSIVLLHVGKNCATVIPVLVNHDYQTFSGKVLEITDESEYANAGLYYYDVVLEVEDEKIYINEMFSSKLNINDRIIYYVSTENENKPVVKINNKDVTARYEERWPLSRPDTEAVIAKPFFSLYVIAFVIYHSYMIKKKYKLYKERREQNIRFILGKDRELFGFLLWLGGAVLFVIVGIITLLNVADNRMLGEVMKISIYLYAIGYLIVILSQNREVVLTDRKMCVKYDHGWQNGYTTDQIISVEAIKKKTYQVIFEDERKIKLSIHNEEQRELLNNISGKLRADIKNIMHSKSSQNEMQIELYKIIEKIQKNVIEEKEVPIDEIEDSDSHIKLLKEMSRKESRKYLIYKKKERRDVNDGMIIILGLIVGIVCFIIKGIFRWIIIGIFLILIVLIKVWEKIRNKWDDLSENMCQYAKIEMHYDEEMEFESADGEVIKCTFYSEVDINEGDEIYVVYIPDIKKMNAETLETMKMII